ncbi:MAG: type IIL restriction-modification enzyme MmeI, partial [bacterium]
MDLKERSAAQEHFIDLCNVFDHPTPATSDPIGATFCFEKGAAKHGGGDGFADVWKKDFFGLEYKGKRKDLSAAYDQLLRYRDALENPPLLIVCDLDRIVVHTNFTGTVSATYDIPLESLGEPRNIEIMRAVFHNPEALRPGRTSTAVTQDAARHFAEIAAALRQRGLDPAAVAHFLDRIVFCLFAEDTGLLPNMVFTRIVEQSRGDPTRFCKILGQLFDTMATGGDFGLEPIRYFNGNLFDDRTVLDLTADEMKRIAAAAELDWSSVDPSIFGTLFERGLDPAKRSQLGAHFTSRADIELVVDAVIMSVLRREWNESREIINALLTTGRKTVSDSKTLAKPLSGAAMKKAKGEAGTILLRFLDRLQHVRVLDPACGS